MINELEEIIEQIRWPMEHRMTMKSRRIYEEGLDTIDAYRGNSEVFLDALNIFQTTYSTPYAYAGIAYTLAMASSEESRPKTIERGLLQAMDWLEKSQYLEPDRTEINFIEAVIYMKQGNLRDARLILDHINQDTRNYYVCLAELDYWYKQGNEEQYYYHWFERAKKIANNKLRQARVFNSLANFQLDREMYEKSIKTFYKVVQVTPDDPWAWHNMSVIFVRIKQFKEAAHCNKQALSIMEFEAARQIEQTIKENQTFFSRLFGT